MVLPFHLKDVSMKHYVMVLICIDTVDVILSDGRDTGSGTIINIHIK